MNRIEAAIEKAKVKCSVLDDAAQKVLSEKLNMTVEEHALLQELKEAMADVLSLEERLTIYKMLGQTVTHFNRQPVWTKCVATQLFKELLTLKETY